MSKRIQAPSPRTVTARNMGGQQVPALGVMHSTVTGTTAGAAAAVARFFATEVNPTSAHYVIDAGGVVQCVPDHRVAYHCGYNQNSLAFEMCDMPVLNTDEHWWLPKPRRTGRRRVLRHGQRVRPFRWLEPAHRAMLNNAAETVARCFLAYGIPIRTLTDAQLRHWDANGRRAEDGGLVTHAQMTRVFRRSTHWDPGAWPEAMFMRRVRRAARRILAAEG